MARVKMCGITNHEDAQKASYYGAWAAGFIFHKKSPRYISPSKARKLIEALPPFITPVGVFVNQSEKAVRDVCRFTRINTVQFHGEETPVYCKRFTDYKIIKAFRLESEYDLELIKKYKVDAYLFDTFDPEQQGGTGKTFDWKMLAGKKIDKPFILSGGLNPENILEAMETIPGAYAFDVNSGVEKTPGIKNPRLIRAFFDVVNFKSSQKSDDVLPGDDVVPSDDASPAV